MPIEITLPSVSAELKNNQMRACRIKERDAYLYIILETFKHNGPQSKFYENNLKTEEQFSKLINPKQK